MANYIPEEKISEIRGIADIVEVVSEVVLLKKTGKNYIGLCPFHSEKTPSFTVSPDKQIFHCFGCGVGGNVFSFLMKQEGMSFPEAVRALARRYGIEVPDRKLSPGQKRRLDEREQLLAINRMALEYYRRALNGSPEGGKAPMYLQRRKLSGETVDRFKLGYAPGGWDNILSYLRRKGVRPALMEKCGLVIPRKNSSGYYDRFRDRIIFPIFDHSMQVAGFGGRVLDDSLPKYLNSPETPVYHKSRSLYGLPQAKKFCREKGSVHIVEGYFDLIALHQHGISNSVATLGTSLTAEHVRILRGGIGEKGRVILVYDSDEAGIKAARRSIAVFDKGYVNAQILVLESGYDPDAYIFQFGADSFKDAAKNALGIIPFLLETAVNTHGLTIEGKVRVIADLQKPLASITDSVERSLYVKEVAERLGIDENALLSKIRDTATALKTRGANALSGVSEKLKSQKEGRTSTQQVEGFKLEQQILAMMLNYPAILPEINRLEVLNYFENDTLRSIGLTTLDAYQPPGTTQPTDPDDKGSRHELQVAEIIDRVDNDQKRRIIAGLTNTDESWTLDGCLKVIQRFIGVGQKQRITTEIDARIREADQKKDKKLLDKLLKEKQAMAVESNRRKMAMLNKF